MIEVFALYASFAIGEVAKSIGYYAWHLLDEVPILKIPETLNWDVPLTLTTPAAGAALLAFKVLIILPLITVAKQLIARRQQPKKSSTY